MRGRERKKEGGDVVGSLRIPYTGRGNYLAWKGRESTVINFTSKNEMFTKNVDLFSDRSLRVHVRRIRVGGFIFIKIVDRDSQKR